LLAHMHAAVRDKLGDAGDKGIGVSSKRTGYCRKIASTGLTGTNYPVTFVT